MPLSPAEDAAAAAPEGLVPNPGILLDADVEQHIHGVLAELIGDDADRVCAEVFAGNKTVRAAVEQIGSYLPERVMDNFLRKLRGTTFLSTAPYAFGQDAAAEMEAAVVARNSSELTPQMKDEIRKLLPNFFGPIADVVAADVLENTNNLRTAIDQLVAYMPDNSMSQQLQETLISRFRKN